MSEQKGLGSKIKRLFLEEGEGGAGVAASAAEEVARLAAETSPATAPGREPPAATPAAANPPAVAGAPVEPAKMDFPSIYKAAALSDDDLAQVDRTEQLLRTLPASLPLETQKQIVEATLKTFGVDPQKVRQTLSRQKHALGSYAGVVKQDTDKRDGEARTRIEALRAEALKLEHVIEERARSRAAVELACGNKAEAIERLSIYLPAAPAAAPGGK